MDNEIIVAILALAGTAIGSMGGIIASSKLTNHRLKRLEDKVDKHNSVIERTYKLETEVSNIKEDIRELKER